jgi:hypothetical protein
LPHLVSLTSFCEGLHITVKIILQVPVQGSSCCHLSAGPGWLEPKKIGGYQVVLNSHFNEDHFCFL